MKVIKPQRLGVLTRVFEHGGRCHLAISVLVFFPLDSPHALLTEVAMWKFLPKEVGETAVDEAMPKPHGEVLVTGSAFPVHPPKVACTVRVQVGTVDKTLRVVGDRRWVHGAQTAPEPFTRIPLTWDRSFGGEGYALNPLGRGAAPVSGPAGQVHSLPNIEDPRHAVTTVKDRPAPAGLGPYDFTWPQRFSKVGTYDSRWLKTRFPGLADDVDMTAFNAAPADQWLPGFFRGDETYLLEHLHPSRPRIEGRLPGVTTRVFVNQRTAEGERFHEVATRLDTVRFFPHAERGVLVYRGVLSVAEDDADDVLQMVLACEDLGAARPMEHYHGVYSQRMDRQRGHLHALRDGDLMPPARPDDGGVTEAPDPLASVLVPEGRMQQNLRRGAERERERLTERVRAAGLDPALHVPPMPVDPPPPDLSDLGAVIASVEAQAAEARTAAEGHQQRSQEAFRQSCAASGLDYEEVMRKGRAGASGPPRFSAAEEMSKLRELEVKAREAGVESPELAAMLADPTLESRMVDAEHKLRASYQRFAHYYPAAAKLTGAVSARLRDEIERALAAGESLAGRDFTGADLSEMDLGGADLHDALLEGADLTRCDLARANLSGAVLARADLTNARLHRVNLEGANLGSARLCRTWLGSARMARATLVSADLTEANLTEADLTGADLSEAVFTGANLGEVIAPRTQWIRCDLSGVNLSRADLDHATFIETRVAGADFTNARMEAAVFVSAGGDGALMCDAWLKNLRVVQDSSFERADFRRSMMDGANLRQTRLAGCDFSGAQLTGADLSGCTLQGASFRRAMARDISLVRADLSDAVMPAADLMGASLRNARIAGADLRAANLYRADMARARADKRTDLTDANVNRVRVVPTEDHGSE